MSKINAQNPQALSNLKLNQPELGDSLAKQGFSFNDPAIIGAASSAGLLDEAMLSSVTQSINDVLRAESCGVDAGPAHAPGAPNAKAAKENGYSAKIDVESMKTGRPGDQFKSGVMDTLANLTGMMVEDIVNSANTVDNSIGKVRNENVGPTDTSGKSILELSINDVVNDPNLTFEEILQKVMMIIARDSQEDIMAKMEELTGLTDKENALLDAPVTDEVDAPKIKTNKSQKPGKTEKKKKKKKSKKKAGFFDGFTDMLRNPPPGTAAVMGAVGTALVPAGLAIATATGVTGVGVAVGIGISVAGGGMLAGAAGVEAGGLTILADGIDDMTGRNASASSGEVHASTAAQPEGASPTAQESSAPMTKEQQEKTEKQLASSKALLMEDLKFHVQRMSEMMQAISGVLNATHDGAMNTIRNIK